MSVFRGRAQKETLCWTNFTAETNPLLIIKQDGHLLFLGKAYGPPEYRESKLGQGLGVMLGVLRDVRLVVLPLWAYGAVYRVALGVGPGENGILVGLPRQLARSFLSPPTVPIIARLSVGRGA